MRDVEHGLGRSIREPRAEVRRGLAPQLRVHLFGGMRVTLGTERVEQRITRAVQSLFAYLLVQRHRRHPRGVIAGVFWGDHTETRARSCLNTTLCRLRRVLEPAGTPRGTFLLSTATGDVGFNHDSDHWLDAASFEDAITPLVSRPVASLDATGAAALKSAIGLYTGDLLDGFYDHWALRERDRLQQLYLGALAHLLHYHRECGAYEDAISFAQRLLRVDPLREDIHRELIRLHLEHGQRSRAARQYEICRAILDAELEVRPAAETERLLAAPLQPGAQTDGGRVAQPDLRDVLATLQRAMRELGTLRDEVQSAIAAVERCTSVEDRPAAAPHGPLDR